MKLNVSFYSLQFHLIVLFIRFCMFYSGILTYAILYGAVVCVHNGWSSVSNPFSLVHFGSESSKRIVHTEFCDIEDALQVQCRINFKLSTGKPNVR